MDYYQTLVITPDLKLVLLNIILKTEYSKSHIGVQNR